MVSYAAFTWNPADNKLDVILVDESGTAKSGGGRHKIPSTATVNGNAVQSNLLLICLYTINTATYRYVYQFAAVPFCWTAYFFFTFCPVAVARLLSAGSHVNAAFSVKCLQGSRLTYSLVALVQQTLQRNDNNRVMDISHSGPMLCKAH